MADTITSSSVLAIGINNEANNPEAKTQYIKLPNPKSGLTENQIKTAVQPGLDSSIYLDNNGVPYTTNSSIVTAYVEEQTVQQLDIGVTN